MSLQISVILPTYNRKPYLHRSLQSIFAQTYWQHLDQYGLQYEVIVVDDGSEDGSADWIQTHYPQVQLIQLPQNQGVAVARNIGIQAARGRYIAFLDSDDRWLPEYLQTQIQALETHPERVLAYCNYISVIEEQQVGRKIKLEPQYPGDLILSLLLGSFIHTFSQIVVPSRVFQDVGLINESLLLCEDREFCLRLFTRGLPIHVDQYLVVKYWLPTGLVTRDQCQIWLSSGLKLLDIFYSNPENSRYAHLRAAAEQSLRQRVEASKHFFIKAFQERK